MTADRELPPGAVRQRGLTLVELLVAMLLGVMLSGGVVTAYLGSKRHYVYEDQVARVQENGRYALQLLRRELAMAGFYGGLRSLAALAPRSVGTDCAAGDWALDPSDPVGMVDDHTGNQVPQGVDGVLYTCVSGALVRPGTDLLAVKRTFADASMRRGQPSPMLTPGTVETWYLRLRAGADPGWEPHQPRDLTDPLLNDSLLSLWEASTRIFFIRRYSNTPGDNLPSLCMEVLAGNAMMARCLVEGVENMQLEFGIDTDGDGIANRYRQAPAPGDLRRAVTANIYLLIRSPAPIPGYSDTRSYRLGSRLVPAAGDPFLRRVFSSSTPLSNVAGTRHWRAP